MQLSFITRFTPIGLCLGGAILLALGCSPDTGLPIFQSDQIRRYQVPRAKPPHRMLAAIVPQGERAWFFKVSGASASLAAQSGAFETFLKSFRFGKTEDADPTWELPESWVQKEGSSGMRFATIEIPTDEAPLEMSVMALPMPPDSGLLSNVNRWRGQIGLAPISQADLATQTKQLEVAGTTATVVDLVGKLGASAPSAGPFTTNGENASSEEAMRRAHAAAGVDAPPESNFIYKAPDNWKPGQLVSSRGGFSVPREAVFTVEEEGQQAEITVTRMPAAAGNVEANANRWASQVGLDRLSSEALAKQTESIEVSGADGKYFQFVGPNQAILGVIVIHGDSVWFIKLQGDHDLAVKLKEHFETFIQSIQF
ncbi:MAG: hypothetical protein CMJ64_30100 [Planctomycetaceae bacterium]|nr:hypothetical protein [Planctomycetaceae bacterium]